MGRAFEYRRASKEARWDKMSKLFPKLSRAITMAAKEGGSDPEVNSKLRTAIQNAKTQNMPKDNVKKAIERAEGKDGSNFVECSFEGKGPHGTMIFVDCATDNNTRTVSNLRSFFNKFGGELLENGSLQFMFTRKTVVEFEMPTDRDLEEIELELIDYGLEELTTDERVGEDGEKKSFVILTADFADFGKLTKACEDKGIEITQSGLKRIPTSTIDLTEEQMADVEKLLDKIEDDEDVQEVFTNIS